MSMFRLHLHSIENDADMSENRFPLWGEIYVEANGCFFPSENWYDAVSSILDMWLPSIMDFMCSKDTECELYFMDGPHKLRLEWVSANIIHISMLSNDQKEAISTCCIYDFLKEIIMHVDMFCKFCRDNNLPFTSRREFSRIDANGNKLKRVLDKY